MALGLAQIVKQARSELNQLTGLDISSTLEAVKEGNEWLVNLEVVEKHSIPEAMDILATYRVELDEEGSVLGFKRIKMRKRIDTEDTEE